MYIARDRDVCKEPCEEVVYSSEPLLRNPAQFFRAMITDMLVARELAWRLLVRNFTTQYRQSFLGFLWVLAPPIVMALTFIFLDYQGIIDVGNTGVPYGIHVLVGTVLWQGFVDALHGPLRLVTSSKSVLAKVRFPREALILASMGEVLLNFGIRLVVLVAVLVFWYRITLPMSSFLVPFAVIPLLAFGLMFGIIMTPLAVLYRDVEKGISILLLMWFFITPIVYPAPKTWPATVLNQLNPLSPLLLSARELLTIGRLSHSVEFLCVTVVTFCLLLLGWLVFRVALPHLIDRMGV